MDTKLKEAVARVTAFLDARRWVDPNEKDPIATHYSLDAKSNQLLPGDLRALVDAVEARADYDTIREQAKAWLAVCHALDDAMPEWGDLADIGMDAAVAAIRKLAGEPMATDLSKRLREFASVPLTIGYADTMRQAADEIERYYGGMVAWRRIAEQRGEAIIELSAQLKRQEVALEAAHARLVELESPPVQTDFATPRVDELKKLWEDDGATRGPAYITMRDLAEQLEHELRNAAPVFRNDGQEPVLCAGCYFVHSRDARQDEKCPRCGSRELFVDPPTDAPEGSPSGQLLPDSIDGVPVHHMEVLPHNVIQIHAGDHVVRFKVLP